MLYIENPVPNDIVRRRKPQYIILLDGVLSLSLPNVYQKWPGTVAVPGSFCAWHARRVYQMSTNATFCRSFVPFGTACGGNPSFFMACKGRHTPLSVVPQTNTFVKPLSKNTDIRHRHAGYPAQEQGHASGDQKLLHDSGAGRW